MATLPTDGYDRDALRAFLVDYGLALGAGDLEALADRFDLPALLTLPERSVVLTGPEQVHDLLRERLAGHRERELVAVVPELGDVEEVGWALLWVDVRWSYRDEYAAEGASEHVRYLLRRGRGTFEVCVVAPVA
ncbi:hypothetical protein [Isoptericola variabilis]|uniref:SnoaL-like domain-containing protein n=1 Tax=Isoptericola variabilis (strain 225) TaxID=743718 RepID=F6FTQ4_ISOV2|nr:hypothetical protein [Isoptericola variabilis]AEG44181.1 hypothetical protein Isova_1416 [Isoptericola variabilis 225]TWH28504.1 hypothetical protein L600_000400001030 [Isoptericola variabilis J7]